MTSQGLRYATRKPGFLSSELGGGWGSHPQELGVELGLHQLPMAPKPALNPGLLWGIPPANRRSLTQTGVLTRVLCDQTRVPHQPTRVYSIPSLAGLWLCPKLSDAASIMRVLLLAACGGGGEREREREREREKRREEKSRRQARAPRCCHSPQKRDP